MSSSFILKQRPQQAVFHVVRRYGPVGGMERYVWELSLQLQQMGYPVFILCERCHVEKPAGITVIELGEVMPRRPRWLAALRFDRRVHAWLQANPQPGALIHSHERIRDHQITTFHGSSFCTVFNKPWWQLVSLRVAMQLFLERRELKNARAIIPNSRITKLQLAQYYPEFAHKLTEPILPGVNSVPLRPARAVPADGGVIGFVGTEWKRKGLPLAIAAVQQLRLTRPNLQFVVIGPKASAVQHLFADWKDGFVLAGPTQEVKFAEFDVLLHPAKMEPYGMVISEAMAAQVPVVFSDACGADISTTPAAGTVLPLSSPLENWVQALEAQLSRNLPVPRYQRSWLNVAQEHENKGKYLENSAFLQVRQRQKVFQARAPSQALPSI